MINDPKIIILSLVAGVIPSLIWLWFWLKEDEQKPEPKGLIATIFILGMAGVILVIPLQKFIQTNVSSNEWQIVLWATLEEIIKYLAVVILLYKSGKIDEPVDWPIFLITSALGFAALENALFLAKPISLNQTVSGILTGQLRFLGSTLLHTVSSGTLGISLGLAFNLEKIFKKIHLFVGLVLAVLLHSAFNFFIINTNGDNLVKVFGFLWIATVVIILLFEKLRRMGEN